ncbi:MAG: hypothetical protein ACKOOI_11500, partial [Pirellula sp.]
MSLTARIAIALLALQATYCHLAHGQEPKHIEIVFEDNEQAPLRGELVTEHPTLGMLVQSSDGQLIAVPPKRSISKIVSIDEPMKPLIASEIAEKTLGLL